jgi:hypothetical protein
MHFCGGSRARIDCSEGLGKSRLRFARMALMNQKLAAEKSKNHRRDESAASTAARAFAFLQALDVLHHTSRVDG